MFLKITFSTYLSEEANKEVYGKCNNPNGHGHNYTGIFFYYVLSNKFNGFFSFNFFVSQN